MTVLPGVHFAEAATIWLPGMLSAPLMWPSANCSLERTSMKTALPSLYSLYASAWLMRGNEPRAVRLAAADAGAGSRRRCR